MVSTMYKSLVIYNFNIQGGKKDKIFDVIKSEHKKENEEIKSNYRDTCFIFIESSFVTEAAGWKLTTHVEIYSSFWRDKRVYNKD